MSTKKIELENKFSKPLDTNSTRIYGIIDEMDIKIAEQAIIKNYDDLTQLADKIEKSIEIKFRTKSVLFRTIVICLGAIFEFNFEKLGRTFVLDESPELDRFLGEFSNIPSISEEELCMTKKYFSEFWGEVKEIAFKIKSDYHSIYQKYNDSRYIELLKKFKKNRPYSITLMLKGINFSRWYKSEIIPESNTYPKSLLLKALFYGAIMARKRSIVGLVAILNEHIMDTPKGYIDIGYGLGFYFGIPSLKTFYRYVNSLSVDFLSGIMLENAEELVWIR
ncbi:MAG: hypothetical protein ACTSO9_19890 [Candidatus Helarchaeota archaeon]